MLIYIYVDVPKSKTASVEVSTIQSVLRKFHCILKNFFDTCELCTSNLVDANVFKSTMIYIKIINKLGLSNF